MSFIKKLFNKKETKNTGLKVLNLFGNYDEKNGKLTIENENKELEQALSDTANTYIETLNDINQMTPEEREQARTDARKEHNREIKQLRNNHALILLQKYQDKYRNVDREYTSGQERILKNGYGYLQESIKSAKELGVDDILLIYVDEDNKTMETLIKLDEVDMFMCDEYILDMKGSFCPHMGELEI